MYPEGSLGHGDGSIADLTICGCQLTMAEDVGPWDGDSTLGLHLRPAPTWKLRAVKTAELGRKRFRKRCDVIGGIRMTS